MSTCYASVVGGIGNQLFIVAAGYAYAKKYNKEFAIDVSRWEAIQGRNAIEYKNSLFKNFNFETPPSDAIKIKEKRFNYNELPYHTSSVVLSGYFQSLKYFEDVKDEFISMLNLPNVDDSFLEEKNVAVHIRRGDYLKYPNIYIHHVCGTEYFKNQLLEFEGFQKHVFTDSIDYIKKEFRGSDFNIIESNSELLDLTFMSKHSNIICSNSSFSWWASLLGSPKKQIIVPDRWFLGSQPHEDIYRPEFKRIHCNNILIF